MTAAVAALPLIRPITDLRTQFNDVCAQATESQEPIILTKNGVPAYVLEDCAAYEAAAQRNRMFLALREAEIEERYRPEALTAEESDARMPKSSRYGVSTMLDLAWRPRAQLDRESIAIYLGLERGMPQAALDAIKDIDAALETVRTFPDMGGHFTDDHLEHEYRTTLAGPYIIYYRYNATTLTVYRIMHQRQSIDTYSLIEY